MQTIEIGSGIILTYTRFKKILGVSQRDMVIISKEIEFDGGIMLVSTSYEHENFPEFQGITRIKIELAGYYLKEDKEHTSVFTITQANFGGIIPHKMMKNTVATTIPRFHNNLFAAIEKSLENKQ